MSPRWIAAAACGLLLLVLPARGQGLAKLDGSLKDIPADAAYYSAWLRNGEQLDLFLKSKAWANLTSQPTLAQFWQLIDLQIRQPGGPFDVLEQLQKDPENKQLVELLKELLADEVFLYGGASWSDFMEITAQLQGTSGMMRAFAEGVQAGIRGGNADDLTAKLYLQTLAKNADRLQVPELIIGFKVKNPKAAAAQLGRLEKLLQAQAAQVPELKGRLKRQAVAGGDFLTLALDGKLIPWDQFPLEDFEEKPGEYKALKKKLESLTATVSLGVRGTYVLLAFGSSTEQLARLGQGKKLIDLPELQPLAKFADRKLTSINYVSKSFMEKVATTGKDIDELVAGAEEMLKQAQLNKDQLARIKKDLEALARDIKAYLPVPGPVTGFTFLNGRGYEGYTYDWSKHPFSDASKPLTLLNHAGGNPLLVAVGRSKNSPEEWTTFVRWIKTLHGYFEEFAVPQMDARSQDQYKQGMKAYLPLLRRFDEAMTKLILPSLADGQNGFVLDAKLTSKQWFAALPPADKPLPMFEAALILGVTDAAKLSQGAEEVRKVVNQMILEARKLSGSNDFPEVQIPAPKQVKLKAGTGYTWGVPADIGLDPRLAPSIGLSDSVAALGLSLPHVERLLTPTPLQVAGGPLADSKRALAAATYFDWAGMVGVLRSWADYGIGLAGPQIPGEEVKVVLDFLACFRSHASATYLESGATVTHSEQVFQDLK